MILFRHVDSRYPFLWETPDQPAARWHDFGDGPVHYLSDTPDGAWGEFLRHEEISDPEDLNGVERTLWAVEVVDPPPRRSGLPLQVVTGGSDTYARCRRYARRLRAEGEPGFSVETGGIAPGGGTRLAGAERIAAGRRPQRPRVWCCSVSDPISPAGRQPQLVALRPISWTG